jgi:uncharacterized protein (DUF2126 family)
MAVEPRDGKLNIFMPPIPELEDYLHLLAAVERLLNISEFLCSWRGIRRRAIRV